VLEWVVVSYTMDPRHQQALSSLAQAGQLPDFVSLEPVDVTGAGVYADDAQQLPLHTKAAAYTSAALHYAYGDPDPVVEQRLHKAAAAFDILGDVDSAQQHFTNLRAAAVVKSAAAPAESLYALEVDGRRYYMLKTAEDVILSGRGVVQDLYEKQLTPSLAQKAAQALVKRAESLGLDLNYLPARLVTLGTPRAPNLAQLALHSDRIKQACAPELGEIYDTIVKSAGTGTQDADEAATLWEQADSLRAADYSRELTPHEIMFSGALESDLLKVAGHSLLLGGVLIPLEALDAACAEPRIGRLGVTESDALTKLAGLVAEGHGAAASAIVSDLDAGVTARLLQHVVTSAP
jgi:hypothetical protein